MSADFREGGASEAGELELTSLIQREAAESVSPASGISTAPLSRPSISRGNYRRVPPESLDIESNVSDDVSEAFVAAVRTATPVSASFRNAIIGVSLLFIAIITGVTLYFTSLDEQSAVPEPNWRDEFQLCPSYPASVGVNEQRTSCVTTAVPGMFDDISGFQLVQTRFPIDAQQYTSSYFPPSPIGLSDGSVVTTDADGCIVVMDVSAVNSAANIPSSSSSSSSSSVSSSLSHSSAVYGATKRAPSLFIPGKVLYVGNRTSSTGVWLDTAFRDQRPKHSQLIHIAQNNATYEFVWWTVHVYSAFDGGCLLWGLLINRSGGGVSYDVPDWLPVTLFNNSATGCAMALFPITVQGSLVTVAITVSGQNDESAQGSLSHLHLVMDCDVTSCKQASSQFHAVATQLPSTFSNTTVYYIRPFGSQCAPIFPQGPLGELAALFAVVARFSTRANWLLLESSTDPMHTQNAAVDSIIESSWIGDTSETVVDLAHMQLYSLIPGNLGILHVACLPLNDLGARCRHWANASVALQIQHSIARIMCMSLGPVDSPSAVDAAGTILYVKFVASSATNGAINWIVSLNATNGAIMDQLKFAFADQSFRYVSTCPVVARDALGVGQHALIAMLDNATLFAVDATPGNMSSRGLLWTFDMSGYAAPASKYPSSPPVKTYTEYLAVHATGVTAILLCPEDCFDDFGVQTQLIVASMSLSAKPSEYAPSLA